MQQVDVFDLERFVSAQTPVFDSVLAELHAGRKRSHWMWFIFPQHRALGHSQRAQFYGIASLNEAGAYLAHPVLGSRIDLCTRAVLASDAPSLRVLFGSPDDMKFCSSMTLFEVASAGARGPFAQSIERWCGGERDMRTLTLIGA